MAGLDRDQRCHGIGTGTQQIDRRRSLHRIEVTGDHDTVEVARTGDRVDGGADRLRFEAAAVFLRALGGVAAALQVQSDHEQATPIDIDHAADGRDASIE